ncbi:conserved hypothetical protein, partial [Trichinella spiralis]|uniref:hypothetical protein n=1 Tax=Trichinella spiralis TaxID=6334 RepID=UPI0001EFED9C
NKDVEAIAAHIGSLKCISSIIGGNENIRRRVLGQIVDMDAYLLQMLTLEECPDDLKLAVYSLASLNILYMLTEDKSEALVVSRLLGLLRNLLAEANVLTNNLMQYLFFNA